MPDQDDAGTLLNLAAVARMMHADRKVTEEEREVFEGLLEASELAGEARARVAGWLDAGPDDEAIATLGESVGQDGRLEALTLAWVMALADEHIDPAEEEALDLIAGALGIEAAVDETRAEVETRFYGATLAVLAALAIMARTHEDPEGAADKRALFGEVVADAGLPEPIAEVGRVLLAEPLAAHLVLDEAASLSVEFQEALLGNLWAMAWADGAVDARERGLFDRFVRACGVPHDRVLALQVEWGPGAPTREE